MNADKNSDDVLLDLVKRRDNTIVGGVPAKIIKTI